MGRRALAVAISLVMLTGCDVIRELQGASYGEPDPAPIPKVEPDAESARVVFTFRPANRVPRIPQRNLGIIEAEVVLGGDGVQYTFDIPAKARDGIKGPEAEVIVYLDEVYLRPRADESVLPEDKFWLSMTMEDLETYMPDLARPVRLLTSGKLLAKLELPARLGRDGGRVRGVPTTLFETRRRAIIAAETGISPDSLDELPKAPAARRIGYWVDRDGFVRRYEFPMPDAGKVVICTVEVFDIDEPLSVNLPVPEDVAPL